MDVNERVEQLERQWTILKRVAALGVVAMLAVAIVGAGKEPAPESIEAKQFNVVGDDGRIYASLLHHEGATGLTIWDAKGKSRFLLSVNPSGTCFLNLNDQAGGNRVSLWIDEENQPSIELLDKTGKRVWGTP